MFKLRVLQIFTTVSKITTQFMIFKHCIANKIDSRNQKITRNSKLEYQLIIGVHANPIN